MYFCSVIEYKHQEKTMIQYTLQNGMIDEIQYERKSDRCTVTFRSKGATSYLIVDFRGRKRSPSFKHTYRSSITYMCIYDHQPESTEYDRVLLSLRRISSYLSEPYVRIDEISELLDCI